MSVDRILITHMHADHVSDLIPLLWSMGLAGRSERLTVYGPPGLEVGVKTLIRTMYTSKSLIPYPLDFVELRPGDRLEGLSVVRADHTVPALGYCILEDDVKVCVSGDTRPSADLVKAFKGATLLFYESTFPSGYEDLAMATGHSTSGQAGRVAAESGVEQLILYHLHGGEAETLRRDAAMNFAGRVEIADDLMTLEV